MTTVTVSPKFPVVIPQKIRESLNIHPGQKVQILSVKGRIAFILLNPPRKMRGVLKGIGTELPREQGRV